MACKKRLNSFMSTRSPILNIRNPLLTSVVIISCLMLFVNLSYGADISDWKRGDASIPIKGTDNISDIDTLASNYIVDPLDKLLTEYVHGCTLTYATAATVTIGVGEVTCWNAAKTIKRMRRNTATVTITLPANGASGNSLDTGNAAISTWYHVYAIADADATTFTGICSASASAPTGASYTYFRYLGSFYNNASDNIAIFYWSGNGSDVKVMWDIPVVITTTVSAGAWSAGATSCSTGMPSTSTCGIFGAMVASTDSNAGVATYLRVNGSTGDSTGNTGISINVGISGATYGNVSLTGQLTCMTDGSQQIDYYHSTGSESCSIGVMGYVFNR
jgi:hypothetical protein